MADTDLLLRFREVYNRLPRLPAPQLYMVDEFQMPELVDHTQLKASPLADLPMPPVVPPK